MTQSINIHATTIACTSKDGEPRGIMLLGSSGSGKSDLTLRLIKYHDYVLVADDRTDLTSSKDKLIASPPQNICGKLEVRGVGIMELQYLSEVPVVLALNLVERVSVPRLPEFAMTSWLDRPIPTASLYPFEASAPAKVECLLDKFQP